MAYPLVVNRDLANRVRKLALSEIIDVLEGKKDYGKDFYKQMLLKLAPTVLPRITEHSGPDGADLFPKPILPYVSRNNGDTKDSKDVKKNTGSSRRNFSKQDGINPAVSDSTRAI